MQRRTKTRIAVAVIAAPVVLVLCLVLYLSFADLSGWRDPLAELLSDSIGREVRITGEFEPEIGLTTRLKAGGITLASPDWSADATMASIEQLTVEIDLLSLIFSPLTIRDVTIENAAVLLEKDADGRANWQFDTGATPDEPAHPLQLVLEHLLAADLELTYREPSQAQPLRLALSKLESTADETGMLHVAVEGNLESLQLELAGRVGPLRGLLDAGTIEHDFDGHLGGIRLATTGRIENLAALTGVSLTAEAEGDSLTEIRGLLPLPEEIDGAFGLSAEVTPSAAGSDLRLACDFGETTARVAATLDSLVDPEIVEGTVTAAGPSIGSLGGLMGAPDLPDAPFSVSGGIRWEGFPIVFKQLEATVGDNTLSVDGVLGPPPALLGTDLRIDGGGPDVSALAALAGLRLAKDRYSVAGRMMRVDGGIRVENLKATIGRTTLTAEGMLGDPPEYAGTALVVHAESPSLSRFDDLVGVELPDEPVAIDGRLTGGQDVIVLEGVRARLGPNTLELEGRLQTEHAFAGSVVEIRARGPDASAVAAVAGIDRVPAEPWSADGTVRVLDRGYRLDSVSASLGSLTARTDGRVMIGREFLETDLTLHIEDADLSHTASLAGIAGLPAEPVRIDGRVRVEAAGIRLEGMTADVDDLELEASGLVGTAGNLDGTQLDLIVSGPRLAAIGALVRRPGLPEVPFSLAGDLRVTAGVYETDGLAVEVDGNRLEVSGALAAGDSLKGTDLWITAKGPDLGRVGALAAGFVDLPSLPPEPFSIAARFAIDESGYRLEGLHATLADAVATVDGRVGPLPDVVGTDLTIDVDGPDASLFRALTGVAAPVAPFRVTGRVQRNAEGFRFDRVTVRLGDFRAAVHGRLGEPPRLVGTDLEVSAAGPSLGVVGALAGLDTLPDQAFEVAGRFDGTPERFAAEELSITVGSSDIRGAFDVDITGKPTLTSRLESKVLDLSPFIPRGSTAQPQLDGAASQSSVEPPTLIFDDQPVDFSILHQADADVEIDIGELQLPLKRFRDIRATLDLHDGRLEISRIAAAGERDSSLTGSLLLEPVGDSYRLSAELDLDAIHLDPPSASTIPVGSRPSIDLDILLDARGRSPHELAISSTGWVQVVAGKGIMDNSILDAFSAPILATLIDTFNPFTKQDSTSEIECAVVLLTLDDGMARLDPMVLKSNKMTMIGDGAVNLATERINLQWITKPRKGFGISATMLTNPYVRLGGTLADPSIQLKEADAVLSTGAAVATAGISLAARGLWDRITAEKNVCKKAHKKIAAARQGK